MKKKQRIILIIVLSAIAIGALCWYFASRPKLYHSERLTPRTLHASPAHQEMLVGLWQQDEHVYYRFNADSTGCTWDTDDDLDESEAARFEWKAYEEAVMLIHKLKLNGIVPRYYDIDVLNIYDFRCHDSYTTYAFEKVEEEPLQAMEENMAEPEEVNPLDPVEE